MLLFAVIACSLASSALADMMMHPNASEFCYHWEYPEDYKWDYHSEGLCGNGMMQSPININTSELVLMPELADALHFGPGYFLELDGYLLNNGHGIGFFPYDGCCLPTLNFNGSMFQFLQLHWHWGLEAHVGSEHWLDERYFPMEVHLVHWNLAYGNVSEALNHEDGLLVMGFWYWHVDGYYDHLLHRMAEPLCNSLLHYEDEVSFSLSLSEVLAASGHMGDFVHYKGSLTTPGCYEIVNWLVFPHPIMFDEHHQMKAFRKLRHLNGNVRAPQDIGDRTVYKTADWDHLGYGSGGVRF